MADKMSIKASIKQKEIKIQKPAQSLTAFQRKVASGVDERSVLIRGFVTAGISLLAIAAVLITVRVWSSHNIGKHETALSALIMEVDGTPYSPVPPDERGERLQSAIPILEELAKKAPRTSKDVALGILSAWRLELNGEGAALPAPADPWSRLRLAQRSIALGQAAEASDLISSLHKDAKANRAWAHNYWYALMQIRQLEGNREQALKDYAEYRKIFKQQADLNSMDNILRTI